MQCPNLGELRSELYILELNILNTELNTAYSYLTYSHSIRCVPQRDPVRRRPQKPCLCSSRVASTLYHLHSLRRPIQLEITSICKQNINLIRAVRAKHSTRKSNRPQIK